MKALVTLLPDTLSATVEDIWLELKNDFGFESVLAAVYPHLTYCMAPDERGELGDELEKIVSRTRPFTVRTEYLGCFSDAHPVLFVGVVKTPELADFHRTLWNEFCAFQDERMSLYDPNHWIPHITLAFGEDLNYENIGPVIERLAFRNFKWEFSISNLTILHGSLESGVKIERELIIS